MAKPEMLAEPPQLLMAVWSVAALLLSCSLETNLEIIMLPGCLRVAQEAACVLLASSYFNLLSPFFQLRFHVIWIQLL